MIILNTLINYFREGLWQQDINTARSPFKLYVLRYLKIFTLATQGFIKDHGNLRASALSLYTLLSIVPVIAMLFGIAKGFGFEVILEKRLLEQVPEQNAMLLQLIEMSKQMLLSTKGGIVAGFGVVVLFWSVLKVISNIEESFNHIWKVKKPRTLGRKLSDYLALMLLAPLLFILASSLNVFVQTQLESFINAISLPGTFVALQLLSYLPILIYWCLFIFIFIFMPNTSVNYRSGFFAGIIAGTVYQCVLYLYVSLQMGVSSYNAIYGSFAALPLFLIWLQVTWVIVLLGSEVCFFYQNIASYQFNQKFHKLNFKSKIALSQHIMQTIIDRFKCENKNAYSAEQLSLTLKIPISIVQFILDGLLECHLLITFEKNENILSYQPAYDVSLLTKPHIEEALINSGESYTLAFKL